MKHAVLTIDDIASKNTPAIVDYLSEKKIPAIMFAWGQRVEEHYENALYAVKNGIIVGNHSYSHPFFSKLTMDEAIAEIEKNEKMVECYHTEGAEFILCAYGTVARVCKAAVRILEEQGVKVGLVRPITLWPFPTETVHDTIAQDSVKACLTVEMSDGQMFEDIRLAVNGCKPCEFMGKAGSIIPSAEEIAERILKMREA